MKTVSRIALIPGVVLAGLLSESAVVRADTLQVGSNFQGPIYYTWSGGNYGELHNGSGQTAYAGDIFTDYLNGQKLKLMYCVDLAHTIVVPGTYNNTQVNTQGYIPNDTAQPPGVTNNVGGYLTNAGAIAYLL